MSDARHTSGSFGRGAWGGVVRSPATADEWDAFYLLRFRALREPWGQPWGSERDELDARVQAGEASDRVVFCAAAFDPSGRLVGVGRVQRDDDRATIAQLRYLAVDEAARGQGVATAVILARVERARRWGVERVFCNARQTSQPLFARLGFVYAGPGPTMFGAIHHARMELAL